MKAELFISIYSDESMLCYVLCMLKKILHVNSCLFKYVLWIYYLSIVSDHYTCNLPVP